MPVPDYALLLDPPAFPAERYAILADRLAALMGTGNDVLLIQAEAVLALEAAATSLARPGLRALNIVTSPYGAWFGGWLARGGATVRNLTASPAKPVTLEEVERALNEGPGFDLLAIVHAESASGILNPLPAIAALARQRGIVTLVDAVASIGGHAFEVKLLQLLDQRFGQHRLELLWLLDGLWITGSTQARARSRGADRVRAGRVGSPGSRSSCARRGSCSCAR